MPRGIIIGVIVTCLLAGCSRAVSPIEPGVGATGNAGAVQMEQKTNRYLWGIWNIQIDPASGAVVVTPNRSLDMHLNVTKLLETSCPDCLKISNIKLTAPHELSLDLTLKHPSSNDLNLTGFDVRGIFISNGSYWECLGNDRIAWGDSDTRLLNPDGYTGLFNPTDYPAGSNLPAFSYYQGKLSNSSSLSATINPFIAYSQNVPRRMFLPGTQETKTIELYIPGGLFKFGYAVDASWVNPGKKVTNPEIDFPQSANCREPYKLSVSIGGDVDEWNESSTQVKVESFQHFAVNLDWLYLNNPMDEYCEPSFDYSVITGKESALYVYTIHNYYAYKQGTYPLLFTAVPKIDTAPDAWQIVPITVHPLGPHPPQVQADAYPKLQSVGWDVEFYDNGTTSPTGNQLVKYEWDFDGDGVYDAVGKDIKHAYDTPGDYSATLRVTDSQGLVGVLNQPIAIHVKPGFGWARTWGSDLEDYGTGVVTDNLGNIYVTGYCSGDQFDMDPGRELIFTKAPEDGDRFCANTIRTVYINGAKRGGLRTRGMSHMSYRGDWPLTRQIIFTLPENFQRLRISIPVQGQIYLSRRLWMLS